MANIKESNIGCNLDGKYLRLGTHLPTFLEDIAVALIVVTRSACLGVHIRNVVRVNIPVKRRPEIKTLIKYFY